MKLFQITQHKSKKFDVICEKLQYKKPKYSLITIAKALNNRFTQVNGIYYIAPSTQKDDIYFHKVKVSKSNTKVNNTYICGCKHQIIHLNDKDKKYCSHVLTVMYHLERERFWDEVEIK